MHSYFSLVLVALFVLSFFTDDSSAKRIAELEKQNAKLKADLDRLAEQLEGVGKPINLGRTSLAAVRASSVNGGRDLTCKYYGIRNAFDDGTNWINNINYTWWLSNGTTPQWIEVEFDTPVTVASIHVASKVSFATQLFWARGGEESHPAVSDRLELKQPAAGVKRVRLTLPGRGEAQPNQLDSGNVRVDEVRILGFISAGTKYAVGPPRLWLTRDDILVVAQNELQQWAARLATTAFPEVKEDAQNTVVTFFHGDTRTQLLRVTVTKGRNQMTVEPLILAVPTKGKPGEGGRE